MTSKPSKGQVILITGCSSGFGLLMAARLAKRHTVWASMRDLNKKDALLKEVARRGGSIELVALDVTDEDSIQSAYTQIIAKSGRIDVIVNNAGYGVGGLFEDLSISEFNDQMDTNYFGVIKVTKAGLVHLKNGNRPKIINISSIAGLTGTPGVSAYGSSKWALEGLSECLRHELSMFGVSVYLVEPGSFPTDIFGKNLRVAEKALGPDGADPKMSKTMIDRVQWVTNRLNNDPEKVAIVVEKIIEKSPRKFRHIVGKDARVRAFVRSALPFRWYEKIVDRTIQRLIT